MKAVTSASALLQTSHHPLSDRHDREIDPNAGILQGSCRLRNHLQEGLNIWTLQAQACRKRCM